LSRPVPGGASRLVRGAVVTGQVVPAPVRPPVTDVSLTDGLAPEQLLMAARAQADALLAEARREAEAIRELARVQGDRDGRAQALEATRDAVERVRALVGQIAQARDAMLANVSGRVIDAVVQLAGVVAQGAIVADPARLERIVRQALDAVREDDRVVVRVHPDDAALLAPVREALERDTGTHVTVRPDRSVLRGGCVVETSRGLVDARLDAKLAAIHTALVRHDDAS
jgi:flagellar assembly protein FliH